VHSDQHSRTWNFVVDLVNSLLHHRDDCSSLTWSLILTLKPSSSPNTNPNPNPTYPTNPSAKTWS